MKKQMGSIQPRAMSNNKLLSMAELSRIINVSGMDFPEEFIEKAGDFPVRTVIPHSIRVGDGTIAGLIMFCPHEDMDYFKIRVPPPEPAIRFRFLQYEFYSVIEIPLLFDGNRQMVLHLNPSAPSVKEFLGICGKSGIISFHYLCAAGRTLVSSFSDVDGEHLEWIRRNHDRALQQKSIPHRLFSIASTAMAEGFKNNQRHYTFIDGRNLSRIIKTSSKKNTCGPTSGRALKN